MKNKLRDRWDVWLYDRFEITRWQQESAVLGAVKSVLTGLGIGLGAVVALSSQTLVQSLIEYGTLPQIIAGIESYRLDVRRNPCNEFLVVPVAEINKRIEYEQKSNERWLTGWASPDGWLNVERIEETCLNK